MKFVLSVLILLLPILARAQKAEDVGLNVDFKVTKCERNGPVSDCTSKFGVAKNIKVPLGDCSTSGSSNTCAGWWYEDGNGASESFYASVSVVKVSNADGTSSYTLHATIGPQFSEVPPTTVSVAFANGVLTDRVSFYGGAVMSGKDPGPVVAYVPSLTIGPERP